jgi:hypothetical protein
MKTSSPNHNKGRIEAIVSSNSEPFMSVTHIISWITPDIFNRACWDFVTTTSQEFEEGAASFNFLVKLD